MVWPRASERTCRDHQVVSTLLRPCHLVMEAPFWEPLNQTASQAVEPGEVAIPSRLWLIAYLRTSPIFRAVTFRSAYYLSIRL